jgi:hypothetical protein
MEGHAPSWPTHTPTLNGSQNAVMVNSSWLLPFSTDKKNKSTSHRRPPPLPKINPFPQADSLPNSLPTSFDITQLPLGSFLPPRVLTASKAFNLIFRPQVLEDTADHIHADVRAPSLKFGHAERTESSVDSVKNETRFLAFRTLKLAETLLEFMICHLDDGKNAIDIWPRIMFPLL